MLAEQTVQLPGGWETALVAFLVGALPGFIGLLTAMAAFFRAKSAEVQAKLAAKDSGVAAAESIKTNASLEEHKTAAATRNETMVHTLAETKATVEEVKKATNGMKDELVNAAYEAGKAGLPKPVPVKSAS